MLSEEEKKLLKIFKAQVEEEETEYFSVNAYTHLDRYITPMRINKFLTAIGIDNPTEEDYREIFKKLDVIAEDIIAEEKEQILKDISRIIKKQAVPNIKEYVESK